MLMRDGVERGWARCTRSMWHLYFRPAWRRRLRQPMCLSSDVKVPRRAEPREDLSDFRNIPVTETPAQSERSRCPASAAQHAVATVEPCLGVTLVRPGTESRIWTK